VSRCQNILQASRPMVFLNASAGRGRARKYFSRAREILETEKIYADFVFTESADDLELRARSAIADGHKLLLAMGGDGTLQGLANAAYGSEVVLGVLPAGGGNDFAAALGLPKDPLAALHALLAGQPRRVDLLRARTSDGRERLYAGGGGVGLDVDALRYVGGAFRRMPGRLRYVTAALRAWLKFTPLDVRVEFPESEQPTIEASVLLAGVLNSPTYGAGLRVAPEARLEDGLLNLSLVKKLNAVEVLGLLPRLLKNGSFPESYLKQTSARRIILRTKSTCLFHGDGEILGPTPVEIEVVPGAIQMLAPVRK
jgi:diacylglycerol kinase (ATP)